MSIRAFLLLAGLLMTIHLPALQAQDSEEDEETSGGSESSSAGSSKKKSSAPKWLRQESQVRALPGWLDETLVLNSNSPEVVLTDGILVSTFPPKGKKHAAAHLNMNLMGRFDIFAHHVVRTGRGDLRTLYLGLLLQNPGTKPVTVSVKQACSILEKPHSPFKELPAFVENPDGGVYAGAGDRLTDLILRGRSLAVCPATITLPPGEYRMLFSLPVPIRQFPSPANCRSTLVKADATGNVYAACLAMRARRDASGRERPPMLAEWQELLRSGSLATPRDRAPTQPKSTQHVIYGRVAGVARGTTWKSFISNDSMGRVRLNIPQPGKAYSYVFSTLEQGAFGTMNYQSAPLVVRYADTAHKAHGNYGVHYELSLPLNNQSTESQRVAVTIQCPYKSNRPDEELLFREPPMKRIFYRGTVRLRYRDDAGVERLRYVHLVMHQADAGKPLVTLELKPGETRAVVVDFLYPPDSTPPQVITVKTLS